jgi:hypothetical protein
MLKLAKAGATQETDTALTTSETTRSFSCIHGYFLVKFDGDFSTGTLTMEVSSTGKNGTYTTYYVDTPAGVPEAQTFGSADDQMTHLYMGHGQSFRFVFDAVGTPDLDIFVSGPGVVLH